MAAANGVPIRLVHDTGKLTEINAQSMTLTTSRKAGGMATPFSGGVRVGIDLNMNKAIILINAVLTDDRALVGSNTGSQSRIDFSFMVNAGQTFSYLDGDGATNANIAKLFNLGNTHFVGLDEYSNSTMKLTSYDGTSFTIKFKKLSSGTFTNTTNTDYTIGINPAGSLTGALFATALTDLINNTGNLSAKFTASKSDSSYTGETNTVVTIQQDTTGEDGNNLTPMFANKPNSYIQPSHEKFKGGLTVVKRSAGDKAMDLYGIMNNSKKEGIGKFLIGAGMVAGGVAITGASFGTATPVGVGVAAAGVGIMMDGAGSGSGYIKGIQIPYNSSVQADGDNYVARNFIMPTGWGETVKSKGSEGNTKAAGATFNGNRTGIKGTVKKLDITYEAGENVYNIVMQFAPVDFLL
jgi:hypothetical protein